jgi:hypothetical protein
MSMLCGFLHLILFCRSLLLSTAFSKVLLVSISRPSGEVLDLISRSFVKALALISKPSTKISVLVFKGLDNKTVQF